VSNNFGYLFVVESDNTMYEVIKQHVEPLGYTVVGAHAGQDVPALIRAQPSDLLLLALDLPDMSGEAVLRMLRDDPQLATVPVLMIADHSQSERLNACLELGALDHVYPQMHPLMLQGRIRMGSDCALLNTANQINRQKEVMLIKIEHDLQIGQDIQTNFLPKQLPPCDGWRIADLYRPAREVGGDLYDVFTMNQSGLIGFLIGDVCDKGVGAALFMALFRSLFRIAAQQQLPLVLGPTPFSCVDLPSLEAVGSSVLQATFDLVNNYVIEHHSEKGYFVTLFFGLLNPQNGDLTYVNGGHVPVVVTGQQGIKTRLNATGPAVGLIPNSNFGIQHIRLDPGDILFTYTDGVTDARSPAREFFSDQRLVDLVHEPAGSAQDLLNRIHRNLTLHIGDAEQYDDITMLVVERMQQQLYA